MQNMKKRILIVDDEEDLTWSISRKLEKDRDNLEVYCANSGNRALEMLSQLSIDLIVTDLRMPGISGWELLNQVKKQYPNIHVIIMTAYGSLEVKEALSQIGETGYIEKPFEINDLRKLILKHLHNTPKFV
jgi:two-component system response regulator (stage 0 sporulation protein F)